MRGDVALMIASAERAAVATDAALPIATAIVAALHRLSIASTWGTGATSSSDS